MAKLTDYHKHFITRLPGESDYLFVNKHNITRLTMLWGDPTGLVGEYDWNTYGDCTNIVGRLSGLKGDVSKLKGDVTNVKGYCTGVELDCTGLVGDVRTIYRLKIEEERFKNGGLYLNKHRFLTNEENERLWDIWLKIANCTIGMDKKEYDLISKPIKNIPPFPVDRWGRYYVADTDGDIVCFSINPADILLLRTNQEIQTCWSIYDKNNGPLRMRLLLARACINPTVGVCFKIKSVEKFNIFNKLPFKYYKHKDGTFFQYNDKGIYRFGNAYIDTSKWFADLDCSPKPYVVGHDGVNALGHAGQKALMFYEKYIKKDFALWNEQRYALPENCEHVLSNFDGVVFLDKDFNILFKTDRLDLPFVNKQIECLKDRIETGVFNEEI